MDCVIPGHSVRPFCASIGCLSKIGRDLYITFDPIEGLELRSLNDAKSAYACFCFQPHYFERCTAPPPETTTSRKKRTLSEASQELRFACRVAARALAAVVRPRRDVVSLRVLSEISSSALYLSFEFHIQKNQDTLLRVVHRIKAADADAVSAIASKQDASEILAAPKVLSRLLEPLKRTVEAALVVGKDAEFVSASSFHHSDTSNTASSSSSGQKQTTNNNAILQATSASLLKTETAISCEEFEEFLFRDDRPLDNNSNNNEDMDMPDDVNEGVILVFPIKEAKAFLQFCSQSHLDQELRVSVYFHWGGRPIVFESSLDSFSAELVLATLDYKLLSSMHAAERNSRRSAHQQRAATNSSNGNNRTAVGNTQ